MGHFLVESGRAGIHLCEARPRVGRGQVLGDLLGEVLDGLLNGWPVRCARVPLAVAFGRGLERVVRLLQRLVQVSGVEVVAGRGV